MPGFTRRNLEDKIKEIYGIDEITHLIDTQIMKYVRDGLTFLDIARALAYYYVVQEGDLSKAKGIGIVPYVINDARKYFAQEAARVKAQLDHAEEYKNKSKNTIICKTKIKKPDRKKPFIDLSGIEVNDDK